MLSGRWRGRARSRPVRNLWRRTKHVGGIEVAHTAVPNGCFFERAAYSTAPGTQIDALLDVVTVRE
jgi:hypothetical protein